MDEYGNLTSEDIDSAVEELYAELDNVLSIVSSLAAKIQTLSFYDAQVIGHCIPDSDDEVIFGYGSVQVRIPRFNEEAASDLWARPHRLLQGRFDIPPIGAWVRVTFQEGDYESLEYFGANFIDDASVFDSNNTPSREDIAFKEPSVKLPNLPSTSRINEVRSNPGKNRILESGIGFIFGVDDVAKIIDLRVAENYKLYLTAGNGGEINIGAADPTGTNPGPQANTIDINIDTGSGGGDFNVKTKGGMVNIETTDGDVTLKTVGGDINLEAGATALEKAILGETLKDKLDTLLTQLQAEVHPTVFGPTGPPTNAGDYATIKSELPDTLSPQNKNN